MTPRPRPLTVETDRKDRDIQASVTPLRLDQREAFFAAPKLYDSWFIPHVCECAYHNIGWVVKFAPDSCWRPCEMFTDPKIRDRHDSVAIAQAIAYSPASYFDRSADRPSLYLTELAALEADLSEFAEGGLLMIDVDVQ